jgi:hypothetical protein
MPTQTAGNAASNSPERAISAARTTTCPRTYGRSSSSHQEGKICPIPENILCTDLTLTDRVESFSL